MLFPFPLKLFLFSLPFPVTSPKLLPFPRESHGNPMGMGIGRGIPIPIPMHASTVQQQQHQWHRNAPEASARPAPSVSFRRGLKNHVDTVTELGYLLASSRRSRSSSQTHRRNARLLSELSDDVSFRRRRDFTSWHEITFTDIPLTNEIMS